MFSLNLSEMTIIRKWSLSQGVLWALVFACGFLFCCCCFLPLPLSFNIHFNPISEHLRGALLLIPTE